MRVYADGSALVRYLPGSDHEHAWAAWAAERESDLLVSTLSVSELRAAAAGQSVQVRALAHEVAARLERTRYFDQALQVAAMATGVLSPYAALHIGVAAAHPDVRMIATYDARVAQVARIHGLIIVTPGMPARWWEGEAGTRADADDG